MDGVGIIDPRYGSTATAFGSPSFAPTTATSAITVNWLTNSVDTLFRAPDDPEGLAGVREPRRPLPVTPATGVDMDVT